MIIHKVSRLKPGLLVCKDDVYFITIWDSNKKCLSAVNSEKQILKPSLLYFSIIGELNKNIFIGENGDYIIKNKEEIEVGDCYEKIVNNKISDVLLVTYIDKDKSVHILHKNGKTEILNTYSAQLLLDVKQKKYLGIHYQVRNK